MNQNLYLEIILGCFASIDIDRLRFYLRDDYSYQDTTKAVFLNQIEKIFKEHKNSGDTELLIYEGICSGAGCTNCGCTGYRFIGNHSRNYLDLIFLTDGDDIKDIFDCSAFETMEYHEEIRNKASIDIKADELITFNTTPEYWSKVNSALSAYDELIPSRPRRLSYHEMCYWMDKHEYTSEYIADDYFIFSNMRWAPFTKLYMQLNEFREYIAVYKDKFRIANNAYKLINEEKELVAWMLEYETMYATLPYEFTCNISEKDEGYAAEWIDSIIFCDSFFIEVFSFILHYKKHHLPILNKYGIYTVDEVLAILKHPEYDYTTNPVYSLKYHLEKRVEAAELGIHIPFNLNGLDAK